MLIQTLYLFTWWLKQVKLYFEFQKFDGEGADDATKCPSEEEEEYVLVSSR